MASGASFAIDISAAFPEGEKTVAQLAEMSSALLAAGVDADGMRDAVALASNALAGAGVSAKLANDALAEGSREYKALEKAAAAAAKAQAQQAALGVVSPDTARAAMASADALEAYGATLKGLKANAAAAAATERSLAGALANTKQASAAGLKAIADREAAIKKAADDEKKAIVTAAAAEQSHDRQLKKTAGALRGLGGPLGSVGAWAINAADDFGDMSKTMGSANAAALISASAFASAALVIAAVGVAVIAATIAIAGWAVGLADSKRSADLTQAAVEAMNPEIAALSGGFAALTKETGATAPELDALAKTLKAAKVSAADMPAALRAAALAEAALGKGGSAEFVEDLKAGKRAASDLSREVSGKLGPIVAKQMMGLSAQSEKFHKNVGDLFGGLDISPVLAGLEKLVGLFDAGTESGQAIKFVFESIFQPLIGQADKAATVIEAFVLGVEAGLLTLYIAAKPAIKALAEFFGFDDPLTADTLASVTAAGELVVPVVAGIAGAFVAVTAAAALVAAGFALPLIAVAALVTGLVYAGVAIYGAVSGAWQKATDYLNSISLEGVGNAIMAGLANGIIGAASLPIQAITNAVSGAVTAAKAALGIHSPSTVFAEIGDNTVAGFTNAVDDGAPAAEASMANMVLPPAPVSGGSSAAQAPAASGGSSFNFAGAVFNFAGVANAEQARDLFEEMILRFTEGKADQVSGPVPA